MESVLPRGMKSDDILKLASLHRHWIIADALRVVLRQKAATPKQEAEDEAKFGKQYVKMGELASMMCRMQVWYSLLFVVVEGYTELGYKYEPLDRLLEREEYVTLLRRFRNATFHYQQDPISAKVVDFLSKEDSEHWIHDLNEQLEAFFHHVLPIDAAMDKLANNGFPQVSADGDIGKVFFHGKQSH